MKSPHRGERSPDIEEDVLRIRPACNEPDEALKLPRRNASPASAYLPVALDLLIDHTGESEAPRERDAQVLVLENLGGEVVISHRLE